LLGELDLNLSIAPLLLDLLAKVDVKSGVDAISRPSNTRPPELQFFWVLAFSSAFGSITLAIDTICKLLFYPPVVDLQLPEQFDLLNEYFGDGELVVKFSDALQTSTDA